MKLLVWYYFSPKAQAIAYVSDMLFMVCVSHHLHGKAR